MEVSYKKNLWLGFEPAINKFYLTRMKIKSLIYVLSEKSNIEKEYSDNLFHLSNVLLDAIKLKTDGIKSTLDTALTSLSTYLKRKSELYSENCKAVDTDLIKSLNELISMQNDLTKNMKETIKDYPNPFINSYQKLKSLKANYYQSASDSEKLIYENIEWKKNEKNNSSKNRKKIQERDKNQMKAIDSLRDSEQKYSEFLPLMNKERETFISKTEEIMSSFENMESDLFSKMQKGLQNYQLLYSSLNKAMVESNIDLTNKIRDISFKDDMQKFISEHHTFLVPPPEFKFEPYHPQSIRNLNSTKEDSKVIARETLTTLKTLLSTFQSMHKDAKLEETKSYEFLEDTILNIIEEKQVDEVKLKDLMKLQMNRQYFLSYLNNIRKEGIISLKKKSFDSLCDVFEIIIKLAQMNDDGICMNSVLILSQAFCLGEEKSSNIKNAIINKSKIWTDPNVWISMITATILNELSKIKEYPAYIQESQSERDTRKHSVVFGKLVSFFFLMKEFNFPNADIMNILKLFAAKYSVSLEEIMNIEANQNMLNEELAKQNLKNEEINELVKKTKK